MKEKMTREELIALSDRCIMATYKRFPIVLTRGLGVHVWDSDGKSYLDLVGGIARKLKQRSEWRLELLDESRKPVFRIRVVAETLDGAAPSRIHD